MDETLNIYEMDYGVHPNGENAWDIYGESGTVTASFTTLTEAVEFAYGKGVDFVVHTLSAWERANG